MAIKTISLSATYTTAIDSSNSKNDTNQYKTSIFHTDSVNQFGVYSWDFNQIHTDYSTIIDEMISSTIIDVQLYFKYFNNSDMETIQILKYSGGDPNSESGATLYTNALASSTQLSEVNISSTNKIAVTTILDDESNFYYSVELSISGLSIISLVLRRPTSLDSSIGSLETSGLNLFYGGSDWRVANSGEPTDPPLLIINYETEEESHPVLSMKYTTADPTTDQSSPENSLGLYVAQNNIYTFATIESSINSTQKVIPIDSDSSLPTSTGLASVGPEVFYYNSIDTTNHELTDVLRGIAPKSSFPAGFDSFKIKEQVYYLNDIFRVFNTRPSSGLIQYRCIAIINSDSNDDFNVQNAAIGIIQNSDSNVQLKIGVEFPKFDTRTGTAIDGNNNTSDSLLVTTIEEENGFFDGAFIKFSTPVEYAVVSSYIFDGTYGEFILNTEITGLVSGRNFTIMPAPAQQVANETVSPNTNSGRFTGFEEELAGIDISLLEHGSVMQENDLFYVWIKRVLKPNVTASNNTGAVLIFRYRET